MKYILGIETAEYPNDLAIIDENGKVISEKRVEKKEQTIENLGKFVTALLEKKNLTAKDICLVAVCLGPGSYTGLRGGLSFAKGFCQYTGIPLVGVSAFEAFEKSVGKSKNQVKFLLDARNERVFHKVKDEIRTDSLDDVLSNVRKRTRFVGSGAVKYESLIKEKLGNKAMFAKEEQNELSAKSVALAGLEKHKEKPSIYSEKYLLELKPLYILPPNITKSKKK